MGNTRYRPIILPFIYNHLRSPLIVTALDFGNRCCLSGWLQGIVSCNSGRSLTHGAVAILVWHCQCGATLITWLRRANSNAPIMHYERMSATDLRSMDKT